MPKVIFQPSGKQIEVIAGTRLFDAARTAGLPVASSCNGEFICGKCAMRIVVGSENLSEQDDFERALLSRERHPSEFRISCHTRILGDCTVTTTYW